MNKQLRNSLLLLITAIIWGAAFVAQAIGGSLVGVYTFNGIRSFIGSVVLIPVMIIMNTGRQYPKTKENKTLLLKGGIFCGIALFIASSLQQLGISLGTQAGKAGFLTACYILLVPIIGKFLGRTCRLNVWIGVVLALAGMYLLCIPKGGMSIAKSDLLVIACALAFSVQILLIDHYAPLVDCVRMASIEFLVVGVLSVPLIVFNDIIREAGSIGTWLQSLAGVNVWISILYAGVMSCGVAYTLQMVAQDGLNPTIASLIMSLEAVFSVLSGFIILHERLSARELIGCGILFVSVIIAQLKFSSKRYDDGE